MKIKHNLTNGLIPKWQVCLASLYGLCDIDDCHTELGSTRGFTDRKQRDNN